ncbi:hypothetical protein CEXT_367981 [Caerostris extrusa]|uniref:Uncharacterized protein n=1 Tax=Caerostris extrusa TaxID=172846 RepID=A0AAV4Y1I8_CAEEX|nr:hypothetical protein CEXT_367981 [Caerostris extrusa]
MHSGCVINSKILIDKFEYEEDFVVPHSNLSPVFDIILGLNFLNKNEFIIDCKNNSLRNETTSINWNFKRSFYNVFGDIDEKINDKCREKLNTSVQNEINRSQVKLIGKSVSKVRIPPNSQRYVENENRLNAVNALDSSFSTFQINSMQINDIIKLQNQDGFCQQIKEKAKK